MNFESGIIFLSKKILALDNENILDIIPGNVLEEIKQKDPHPYFQMYSVAHEGTFSPEMKDDNGNFKRVDITWKRKAIESIKNIAMKGIKLFKGHEGLKNNDPMRRPIGEVVHNFEKEIKGKLHHLVIAYHSPEVREEAKKYDICSQEAVWNFARSAGRLFADSIKNITGIACQSSEERTPAFSGAKRLGFIQAFDADPNNASGAKTMNYSEIISEITKSGIDRTNFMKSFVKDFGIRPRHVFTKDDLKDDHDFRPLFEEFEKNKNDADDYKKKFEESQGKIKELEKTSLMNTAKNRVDDYIKSMPEPLTENQIKFVNKQFEKGIDDLTDDGIKNFINNNVNIYKDVVSVTNPDSSNSGNINNNSNDSNNNSETDYTKKENNPLLDEDLED
jgi:uncharacterized protein (DUF2249 family)